MKFLTEICEELEVDTTNLQKLVEGEKLDAVNTIHLPELKYFHK